MENNTNELIVLEQLPIIKATLENLSVEIKKKVDRANSLVVNEETVKEVKQVRANLTKEFNELEEQRKQVKSAIMEKYDEFEKIYKDNVSNLYKQADADLKEKIDNVENQLKQEKQEELELFAREYFNVNQIEDIVCFDDICLNITLSASMKSLKEQIISFCEKIVNDLKLIEVEEYKDEILVEYKKNLDFTKSKLDVIYRHKELDRLRKEAEEIIKEAQEEQKMVEKVEEIITPPKEIFDDEQVLKVTFTIETTKSNIVKLKNWLKERGIKYE